ncbi:HAD family hydrolase [Cohnella sp. GCM10020058]|uniref:HAD family hydrolase n=1 Tax=Cohnella sp. GCM10020058 TaxID=3317330 RepID=UPI00362B8BB0
MTIASQTKAVIFDFDGTILDTETAWYEAFKSAYREYEVDLSLDMYAGCIGTSLHKFNPYEYLITDLKLPIDPDLFRESVHELHGKLMEREQMRPGVLHFLNSAKAAGLKIGLASSSRREWVETHLKKLGILDYFDCIRTADDVSEVKPSPELYMQALRALGVSALEAIAIEDSPNGAKAAEDAGIRCIVTPNPLTKRLEFGDCLRRVESLLELDFHRIVNEAVAG